MRYDLIAVDPGNEGQLGLCACATFHNRCLISLRYHDWQTAAQSDGAQIVALEVPEIYPYGHERPNDLIQLGIAGALVAAALRPAVLARYTPAQWKGQQAKPVCHIELWEKLTPYERALFPADTESHILKGVQINAPRLYKQPLKNYSFKAHNLLDAAAIGCHNLGR